MYAIPRPTRVRRALSPADATDVASQYDCARRKSKESSALNRNKDFKIVKPACMAIIETTVASARSASIART